MKAIFKDRPVIAWALYDWANSAYATTVMAGFFPVFFKSYWGSDLSVTQSTFHLGVANSLASMIVVIMAPLLGAIADRGSARKRLLIYFTLFGVLMTGALSLIAQGDWEYAVVLFVLATIGFSASNIFYDALILNVVNHHSIDKVSALGFAMGYLGGGILFAVNVMMTLFPESFGFSDAAAAVQASFVMVAIWWAVFTIPLMIWVPEPREQQGPGVIATVSGGITQLLHTFQELRKLRVVSLFLLGYWLYIDGVDTIIRMAVDYGLSLGFERDSLILALLITQFVGFPAAIFFGWLGDRIGTRRGIYIALSVYILVCIYAYFMRHVGEFYLLAIAIGLVQGGVQSLSRSFYARIIPANKSAEFFGFYNMLGKFAAVLGPVMMGWVGVLTGSSRASILSVLILFVIGMFILSRVDEKKGVHMARELEKV